MSMLAKIFADDVRHLTSNIVSIIITIGLIVIPGLFTWFNVAACWDPFANTKNLQFAIANDDEGYKGDLLPMRINIGEQVVDTLRANSQLDWTFTKSSAEAIDGTKSGKYYPAVVIPKNFSKNMMTFFTDDAYHATLDYYNNEKLNALAPKVTGQGADTIAATINQTFSKTLTDTALNLASSMLDMLDKPEYQQRLKSFNGNIADLAGMLNDSAAVLRTYSSLTDSAKTLLASSNKLIADARASAKTGVDDLSAAKTGVSDLSGALGTSVNALGTAIDTSKTSLGSLNVLGGRKAGRRHVCGNQQPRRQRAHRGDGVRDHARQTAGTARQIRQSGTGGEIRRAGVHQPDRRGGRRPQPDCRPSHHSRERRRLQGRLQQGDPAGNQGSRRQGAIVGLVDLQGLRRDDQARPHRDDERVL